MRHALRPSVLIASSLLIALAAAPLAWADGPPGEAGAGARVWSAEREWSTQQANAAETADDGVIDALPDTFFVGAGGVGAASGAGYDGYAHVYAWAGGAANASATARASALVSASVSVTGGVGARGGGGMRGGCGCRR
jgi:hypothetical protein